MDKINLCSSSNHHSVSSLPQISNKNERIANSFVTKLEAYHYPDNAQRKTISRLLDKFCCSDSIKEVISIKKEISRELDIIQNNIYDMRKQVFNIVNRDTDRVYGILNQSFTVNDRDRYIKELMYYHEVQKKITEVTHGHFDGNFAITVPKLGSHHSSSLWGDMAALERLINGEPAKVPNLTYNVGCYQFG